MLNRIFLDTSFIQALLDRRDQLHQKALSLAPLLQAADEIWITEAVCTEIADALSAVNRSAAIAFINRCRADNKTKVVNVSSEIFEKATELYRTRSDKTWGLTDCISFVVMQEQGLSVALTADRHFIQSGFRALLAETT